MPEFPPVFHEAIEAAERRPEPHNPDIVDALSWRFEIIKSMAEPSAYEDMTLAERQHTIETSWKKIINMASKHAKTSGTPQADRLLIHMAARRAGAADLLIDLLKEK